MASENSYISLFTALQADLDKHHNRREAIAKASRDITAASKKIIFALHRSSSASTASALKPLHGNLSTAFRTVLDNMPADSDAWRYKPQLSPGLQELVEAVLFKVWLENGTVMSWEQTALIVQSFISDDDKDDGRRVLLTHEDYLLGMLDFTGEVMRWCVTAVARDGHSQLQRTDQNVIEVDKPTYMSGLTTLREVYASISTLSLPRNSFANEVTKKLEVLASSVEKVENSVYSMAVRGAERAYLSKEAE